MSYHVFVLDAEESDADIKDLLNKESGQDKEGFLSALINYLEGMRGGSKNAAVNSRLACDYASLAGTFTDAPTADDTVSIGGVTLTAKASPASEDEFDIEGTATAQATELAAVINAHSELSQMVTASSALGVVTVKAKIPGTVGNGIVVTDSLDNFTWASAATSLASGDEDIDDDFECGRTFSGA